MKERKAKQALAIMVVGLLFLVACKKTVTQIVQSAPNNTNNTWQSLDAVNLIGANFYNSGCFNDSLFTLANGTCYFTMNVGKNGFSNAFFLTLLNVNDNLQATSAINFYNNYCIYYATNNTINILHIPYNNQFSQFIYVPNYTPGLNSIFSQLYYSPDQCFPVGSYPLNSGHYMLSPVETADYNTVRFDLVNLDTSFIGSPGLPTHPNMSSVKMVSVSPAAGTLPATSFYYCATFFNKFFVNFNSQLYRIDTLGNVKAFGYNPVTPTVANNFRFYNMFSIGNNLFINSYGNIFYSTDKGETWQQFNTISNYPNALSYIIFGTIDDKLYATMMGSNKLFIVGMNGNNFYLNELNNTGIPDNSRITSLTRVGKYFFVTTYNGVYYRDTAYVNQLKTPIH
jgi:hypothetical protein